MRTSVAILNAIQSADPDGGEVEPTDAMYAAHKAWAIGAFGEQAWADYSRGGWADDTEWQVGDHAFMADEYGY